MIALWRETNKSDIGSVVINKRKLPARFTDTQYFTTVTTLSELYTGETKTSDDASSSSRDDTLRINPCRKCDLLSIETLTGSTELASSTFSDESFASHKKII